MNLPELHERIDHDFTYHPPPDESTKRAYKLLRSQYRGLAHLLAELVPGSRELSLALTDLEESLFHANSGIARRGLRKSFPGGSPEDALEEARRHAG